MKSRRNFFPIRKSLPSHQFPTLPCPRKIEGEEEKKRRTNLLPHVVPADDMAASQAVVVSQGGNTETGVGPGAEALPLLPLRPEPAGPGRR